MMVPTNGSEGPHNSSILRERPIYTNWASMGDDECEPDAGGGGVGVARGLELQAPWLI